MKEKLKQWILKCCPSIYYRISSYRVATRCKKLFLDFQTKFASDVYADNQIKVLYGPFKDLKYYNKVVWGPITPKWIGSYEEELHEIVDGIIENNYARIIDVGAAEGYYAVGLANTCPKSKVYSYDIDPIARKRQGQLADLNGITNLTINKYCSHDTLSGVLDMDSLLICDIEGYEYELLDPTKASKLEKADILVEIHAHEGIDAETVRTDLVKRFEASHDIETITVTKSDAASYQNKVEKLKDMQLERLEEALKEYRMVDQKWLWMKSK